jgi:hypothetical protein
LGFPRRFVTTHAGRIRRHSCYRNAYGVRPPFEEGDNRTDGNVTLHHVAINQRCVTRGSIQGNANIGLERSEAPILLNLDIRSVVL